MKRKILWVLSFLLVAALVLASCAEAEVGEQEEEEITPPQSRFEGTEIYFFPGGSEGCTFASVVYRGAKAAADDLGVDMKVYWSDWNPEIMVSQFKEAVAAEPDGIAIMGHPGVAALKPHIDEAIAKGIIVTSVNVTLPELEEDYAAKGFGYVGQELYASGYILGSACAKRFNLGSGDKAMVWGLLQEPERGKRTLGVIDALEEAGLTVDYIQISTAVDADPSVGVPVITGYLSANPDTDLVVTDHGNLTSTLPQYFEAAGYDPGEIYGAGFDLSPATADGIKAGYIHLVLDQQPYLQGYLPIVQICLTKYAGFSGLHIDTGAGLVHEENIDVIAPLAAEGIR